MCFIILFYAVLLSLVTDFGVFYKITELENQVWNSERLLEMFWAQLISSNPEISLLTSGSTFRRTF